MNIIEKLAKLAPFAQIRDGADSPPSSPPEQGSGVEVPWSEDEAQSAWALGNVGTLEDADEQYEAEDPRTGRTFMERGRNHEEVLSDSPREVLYSILRGDRDKEGGIVSTWGEFYDRYAPYKSGAYYENALVERAEKDVEFFKDGILRLWNKLGISPLNTISVEQFLFNEEYGYAGQVDLVYEDADGYIVVADLKSSSGCYDKHQIQGAAYAKSVEVAGIVDEVDRLEVHRAHPRTGQMAAHTHRDAPGKSSVHTTQWWNDGIEDLGVYWFHTNRLTVFRSTPTDGSPPEGTFKQEETANPGRPNIETFAFVDLEGDG